MRDALILAVMLAVIAAASWYLHATRPLTRDELCKLAEKKYARRMDERYQR